MSDFLYRVRPNLLVHLSSFYQGNVAGQKRGSEQTDKHREPYCAGCDALRDWPVAYDEVGVHPDKNAAQLAWRIFAEVYGPPEVPETVA